LFTCLYVGMSVLSGYQVTERILIKCGFLAAAVPQCN